ncbi:hypothetical protein WAF17_05385 [Bernardetia sp. ABR2-2B]|uniref:hypothetical protein n=1 Tax=Bernardetia sp. ABR2-2B TaxID=3127472 RepID=UPI0030CCB359
MNYNTHKLNSQNHSHIIGRQDSVTGDTIKSNDEVVFCSACQSVFLKESWEYMNKEHCNQSETLKFVPVQDEIIKARKRNALLFEIAKHRKVRKTLFILSYLIIFSLIFFGFCISELFNLKIGTKELRIIITILSILEVGFVVAMSVIIVKLKKQNTTTKMIQIYEDKLVLFGQVYKWKEITSIIYKANKKFIPFLSNSNTSNKIRIYLHNNLKEIDLDLKINYSHNVEFLDSLMKASKFTEVIFYLEDVKEHQFLKEEIRKYEGNIILTDKIPFY